MTEDEFISALEKTPRTWTYCGRAIKTKEAWCPMEAVIGRKNTPKDWPLHLFRRAGIDAVLGRRIAKAADLGFDYMHPHWLPGWDQDLRDRIRIACDLPPLEVDL